MKIFSVIKMFNYQSNIKSLKSAAQLSSEQHLINRNMQIHSTSAPVSERCVAMQHCSLLKNIASNGKILRFVWRSSVPEMLQNNRNHFYVNMNSERQCFLTPERLAGNNNVNKLTYASFTAFKTKITVN